MDDVSCLVQHDVPIVSVLDLQQEADDAVGRHRHHKVVTCLQNDTDTTKFLGACKMPSTPQSCYMPAKCHRNHKVVMCLQNATNTTKLLCAWQTPLPLQSCYVPAKHYWHQSCYMPAKHHPHHKVMCLQKKIQPFADFKNQSSGKVLLGDMSPTVKTLHLVSWDDPKLLNQHQEGLSCSKNQIPNDQCIQHSTRQPKMTTRRINHFPRPHQLCGRYPPPSQQSFLYFQTDASSSLTFIGDQSTN